MDQLQQRAHDQPDGIAMRFDGIPTTWSGLSDRVTLLAEGLHGMGVRFGDGVAVIIQERSAVFETVLAANRLGAVVLPVDCKLSAEEVAFIVESADSRYLCCDPSTVALSLAVRERLSVPTATIVIGEPVKVDGPATSLEPPPGSANEQPAAGAVSYLPMPARHGSSAGEVNAEDQELVTSLVATAGVAMENARLFDAARRRRDWLDASTEITRTLLAGGGGSPLEVISNQLRQLADADSIFVAVPVPGQEQFSIDVAIGADASQLVATSFPVTDSLCHKVMASGTPIMIGDIGTELPQVLPLKEILPVGPVMVLPLTGTEDTRGVLVVCRLRGRAQFTSGYLEMATTFANHAAVALELTDAHADRARLAVAEDRNRIARDLHDNVIQQLFAAGLAVEILSAKSRPAEDAASLTGVVDSIDQCIRQLRTSIFQLRGPLGPDIGQLRTRLLAVLNDASGSLGFYPEITFTGPVDTLMTAAMLDDVVVVAREALSNITRHAVATRVDVQVKITTSTLTLRVTDDGVGLGAAAPQHGLSDLQQRAEQHGGTLTVSSPYQHPSWPDQPAGTSVRWSIPVG